MYHVTSSTIGLATLTASFAVLSIVETEWLITLGFALGCLFSGVTLLLLLLAGSTFLASRTTGITNTMASNLSIFSSLNLAMAFVVVCTRIFLDKPVTPKPQDLMNPKHSRWLHLTHRWSVRTQQGDTVQLDIERHGNILRYVIAVTSFAHGVLFSQGEAFIPQATKKNPSKTTLEIQRRQKGFGFVSDTPAQTESISKSRQNSKSKSESKRNGLNIGDLSLHYDSVAKRWHIAFAGTMKHSLRDSTTDISFLQKTPIDPEVYTQVTGVCCDDDLARDSTRSRGSIRFLTRTLARYSERSVLLLELYRAADQLSKHLWANMTKLLLTLVGSRQLGDIQSYTTTRMHSNFSSTLTPISVVGLATFVGTVQVFRKRAKSARVLCKPVISMFGVPAVHTRHAAPWISGDWPRNRRFLSGGVAPVCMIECHRVISGLKSKTDGSGTIFERGDKEVRVEGEEPKVCLNRRMSLMKSKQSAGTSMVYLREPDDRARQIGVALASCHEPKSGRVKQMSFTTGKVNRIGCASGEILSLILSAHRDANSGVIVWGGWVRTSNKGLLCLDACHLLASSKPHQHDNKSSARTRLVSQLTMQLPCDFLLQAKALGSCMQLVVKVGAQSGGNFVTQSVNSQDSKHRGLGQAKQATSDDRARSFTQTSLVDVRFVQLDEEEVSDGERELRSVEENKNPCGCCKWVATCHV